MGQLSDRVEQIDINLLKPYEKNAKKHPPAQIEKIANNIKSVGFLNPCLIDREYRIICGHGRVLAAKKLGWEKIPCIFAEGLTEAQRRAYILADNRLGELGEWDKDLVSEELQALRDLDFDIDLTGFSLDDISSEEEPAKEDDFDTTPPEQPITREKEIWVLGAHRVMCGDSTNEEDVRKLMGGYRRPLLDGSAV